MSSVSRSSSPNRSRTGAPTRSPSSGPRRWRPSSSGRTIGLRSSAGSTWIHVDPALERSPLVLPEDEGRQRRGPLEGLRVGAPVLERFGDELRETEDMLALCDPDGYVLATRGHPRVLEAAGER